MTTDATREKVITISQSNYIPWKGYFDLIRGADEFVIYDDMQYTKNDWRNRNRIKTANGPVWLTIPIQVKGRATQRIRDAEVNGEGWRQKHWRTLCQSYGKAPFFDMYHDRFKRLYLDSDDTSLSRINQAFITEICDILDIRTRITRSEQYQLETDRVDRLVSICTQLDGRHYLTGPSAQNYMDDGPFQTAGISVHFMDYSGYPEYTQLHPPFEHAVSILDLIFHTGPSAPHYMKRFVP